MSTANIWRTAADDAGERGRPVSAPIRKPRPVSARTLCQVSVISASSASRCQRFGGGRGAAGKSDQISMVWSRRSVAAMASVMA